MERPPEDMGDAEFSSGGPSENDLSHAELLFVVLHTIDSLNSALMRIANVAGEEISREEADLLCDDFAKQSAAAARMHNYLKDPLSKSFVSRALRVAGYAEGLLIPALYSKSSQQKNVITKTYVLRNSLSGLVKIGKSINVEARIAQLSTGAAEKMAVLCIIERDVEKELHVKFAHLRVFGEWFRDDGSIAEYLNSLGKEG